VRGVPKLRRGDGAGEVALSPTGRILALVRDMSEDERVNLFAALATDWCRYCGGFLPGGTQHACVYWEND
jgi:hypothetical protein